MTFFLEFSLVSAAYLISFYATFEIWMPLQAIIAPGLGTASLLFLPHGIRVIVAFAFGLRGALLLLPASAITHFYLFGVDGFTTNNTLGLIESASIVPIIFHVGNKLGYNISIEARPFKWRQVMAAGMLGAVLNATFTNLAYGSPLISYYAYAVGDFFGQLLCFAIMVRINSLFSAKTKI